jgi:hypothetical protein
VVISSCIRVINKASSIVFHPVLSEDGCHEPSSGHLSGAMTATPGATSCSPASFSRIIV